MTGVNVYTEWGKLKEVVVGNVVATQRVNVDLSFKLLYNQNIKDVFLKSSYHLQAKLIEERQEDLDGLQTTLEGLGVVVRRPKKLESVVSFKTPHFEAYTTACANPRDQVLIAGDEIIESACMNRSRYFENDLLKEILYGYFRAGSRWTCAPRPIMTDSSFDFSHVKQGPEQNPHWNEFETKESSLEIMFDAAQCLKFGRDIVMNVSTANHELGAAWLERHLEGRFRVHRVALTDYHIDGMFMPLRPGVLLINPVTMYGRMDRLPKALQKWDVLVVPEEDQTKYPEDSVLLASSNINVNVLPVDEERVIVFDSSGTQYSRLIKALEHRGFTPIPVRLRHSRVFDGGAHCATLDTIREDQPEDFFS